MIHGVLWIGLIIVTGFIGPKSSAGSDTVETRVGMADSLDIRLSHLEPGTTPLNNQIWSIQESVSGWVFFAEEEGILALRGSEWRLIETPNATTTRSLEIQKKDGSEKLFYGEQGDFGYVEIDSSGSFRAISLKHLVPESISFGDVWNVIAMGNQVFFQSRDYVFLLKDETLSYWYSESGFHNSFGTGNRFFVREFGIGLKEYLDEDLLLTGGGTSFADVIIAGITVGKNQDLIVWTWKEGQFVESRSRERFEWKSQYPTELRKIATEHRLYYIEKLDATTYVIATLGGGLLVVGEDGRVNPESCVRVKKV